MICPVCKLDMIVVEYSNIELDYCTTCKGVWFDSGELELLLDAQGQEEAKPFLDNIFNSPDVASPEKGRKCPICSHKMKKSQIDEQPVILIDVCPEKHGLWFDGGEVSHLIGHATSQHLPKSDSREQVVDFMEEVFEAKE